MVDRLRADGRLLVQPTFFEVTTAVAFELFQRAGVEIAVCEVGLGGRLDATNVLAAGRDGDHVDWTRSSAVPGPDPAGDRREKAGIIKPGVPVVVGPMEAEARAEIERIARERGRARRSAVPRTVASTVSQTVAGLPARGFTFGRRCATTAKWTLGLPGAHQVEQRRRGRPAARRSR